MRQLPDYQRQVREHFQSLHSILSKYTIDNAPLGAEEASRLAKTLEDEKQRCEITLSSCRPRIMFYGLYNSGKSTLLNAMFGQEIASVADKPETCKITAYEWRGYDLLDTPGLDAPIDHETMSKEALKSCHVIVFVISARDYLKIKDRNIIEQASWIIEK